MQCAYAELRRSLGSRRNPAVDRDTLRSEIENNSRLSHLLG
jgi:hypothetical protein